MGNLAFDISKIVDLNKVVNLDIDKNIDVTVNNPDILATAEADAEAFGSNALAEVDAYTYVNEGNGGTITEFSSGQIEVLGNIPPYDDGVNPGDPIFIDFTAPPESDVDDVNASGHFVDVADEPSPGTPIPDPLLTITDIQLSPINPGDPALIQLYENANDPVVIDYGTRYVERNGDGEQGAFEVGNLTLTFPVGTEFLVEFNGGIVIVEDLTAPPQQDAFFTFDPEQDGASSNAETFVAFTEFRADMVFDSLGDFASYEIDAITDQIPWHTTMEGNGEAFAYAESTSSLDLNNDDVLAMADVI